MELGLPEQCRAAHIRTVGSGGGPEALELTTLPLPWEGLGRGDVMLRVAAAGVNEHDVQQRRGHWPHPPSHSSLPGLEVAGRVVALGGGVEGQPRLGDTVCALVRGGGYAEYAIAPALHCQRIPPGLSAAQAACLPLALSSWAAEGALPPQPGGLLEPCLFHETQPTVPLSPLPELHAAATALLQQGALTIAIDSAWALEDADHAHRRLESGEAQGRVVLLLEAPEDTQPGRSTTK